MSSGLYLHSALLLPITIHQKVRDIVNEGYLPYGFPWWRFIHLIWIKHINCSFDPCINRAAVRKESSFEEPNFESVFLFFKRVWLLIEGVETNNVHSASWMIQGARTIVVTIISLIGIKRPLNYFSSLYFYIGWFESIVQNSNVVNHIFCFLLFLLFGFFLFTID